MSSKLTSAYTYILLALVIGVCIYLITDFGVELSNNNPNTELSTNSEQYITEITGNDKRLGFNTSIYAEKVGEVQDGNESDNKNDFSLDFVFGKSSSNKIQRFVYIVLNLPELLIVDIFRLQSLKWFADLLDWFLRIALFMAVVLYIRRGE